MTNAIVPDPALMLSCRTRQLARSPQGRDRILLQEKWPSATVESAARSPILLSTQRWPVGAAQLLRAAGQLGPRRLSGDKRTELVSPVPSTGAGKRFRSPGALSLRALMTGGACQGAEGDLAATGDRLDECAHPAEGEQRKVEPSSGRRNASPK